MTIIHFKKKYIFIANKKTGSTSIHNILKKDSPDICSTKTIHERPIGKHDNYTKIKKFLDSKNMDINQFYIFGFVRNPITRIKSCYKYEHKKKMTNVQNLEMNSKDFNHYIKKDLNLHFSGIDTVFYNHEGKIPPNVHIFEIEKVAKQWRQIESKLGLTNTVVPNLNHTSEKTFYLEPSAAIVLRKKYPLDWDLYFKR